MHKPSLLAGPAWLFLLALAASAMVSCAREVAPAMKPAADAHRSRLASVMQRARQQEPVTIAFFGGSITWGATATDPLKTSWRALVMEHLRKQYPHTPITFVDAAIGGQPSRLGVFRMDRDVLPCKPDLVFLEFTVNDGSLGEAGETYEGVIRKIRRQLPQTAIVPVIVGYGKEHYVVPSRDAHLAVARHYALPVIDIVPEIQGRVAGGLKLSTILTDGVHPNDAGYRLYADLVISGLDRLVKTHSDGPEPLPLPLTANRFQTAAVCELSKLDLPEGWQAATPSVIGTWIDHTPSRWFSSVVQPNRPEAALTIPVARLGKVNGIGLYFEQLPGGEPLVLESNGNSQLTVDCRNSLQFARVSYQFQFLPKAAASIVLRAPKGGPAAAAYLLYTTDAQSDQ